MKFISQCIRNRRAFEQVHVSIPASEEHIEKDDKLPLTSPIQAL